jgi:hypothetical protein
MELVKRLNWQLLINRTLTRRHMLRRPEVGAGYLSSFADENTGFPRHKRDEKK